jgi:adenosyl cobinamide kinase/adenosyl cobinamide phosphate guanylyltransferase
VLGGIRSGKSRFAADLAQKAGGRVAVVATGTASDEEMRERIELHRRSRPRSWRVYEAPERLTGSVPAGSADTIVLDSVDGWLATTLDPEECVREVLGLCESAPNVVAVSSEVGLSLVALTPSGRAFSDALGSVNQQLATRAEAVYLVVAGLPVTVKGAAPKTGDYPPLLPPPEGGGLEGVDINCSTQEEM